MEFEFYAQMGDVSTTTPWKRPTMMTVSDWWKEFSFEVGLEDYDVWMCGSFMEKTLGVYAGYPNDFDVVLTGNIKSEKKLKYLLDRGMEIGFEKRILVDIFWSSDVLSTHYDPFKPYANIRNGKTFIKQINDDVTQTNFSGDEVYTLSNGLTQFVYYEPSKTWKKVQYRKDAGQYVGVVVDAREFFE